MKESTKRDIERERRERGGRPEMVTRLDGSPGMTPMVMVAAGSRGRGEERE